MITLYLNRYEVLNRETTRHKFKIVKFYDRLKERDSNLKEDEVPFTEEIKNKALNECISKLSVKLWRSV
jgi:hypothetical protein